VYDAGFFPDGDGFATVGAEGSVVLWRTAPSGLMTTLSKFPARSLAFSADGRLAAKGTWNGMIELVDVVNRSSVGQLTVGGHRGAVQGMAFSPDGTLLASIGQDNKILIWDIALRKTIGTPILWDGAPLVSLRYSPDGRTIVIVADDGTVAMWDTATQQEVSSTMEGALDSPATRSGLGYNVLAFHPVGRTLISGEHTGAIEIWDWTTGMRLREPLVLDGGFSTIALSPDGTIAALHNNLHSQIVLVDTVAWEIVGVLPNTGGGVVWTLSFSPDGRMLAAGGWNGQFVLWDVHTRRMIGEPISAAAGPLHALAFSPEGSVLITAGVLFTSFADGGENLLWSLDTAQWTGTACGIAGRNLTREEWSQYLGNEPYRETCPGH
jgi:WD40 repeat protein